MQSTIQFERSNPLQQLMGLARTMALPHEFAPTRFPSFPALERTAVIGFNVPTTVSVPATGMRAMLCRQAAYPLWVDFPAGGTPYSYTFGHDTFAGERLYAGAEFTLQNYVNKWFIGNSVASASQPGVGGTLPIPTGYAPFAYDMSTGTGAWFYVPANSFVGTTLIYDGGVAPASDPGWVVSYDRWSSPGEVANHVATVILGWNSGFKSGAGGAYFPLGGWYRASKLNSNTTTTWALTVANSALWTTVILGTATGTSGSAAVAATWGGGALSGVTALLPLAAPPEFANSVLPYSSTRTTAAAALFTNVTKALNKEGTVMGGRINPANTNVWNFTSDTLVNLHPAEKQMLGLETGSYTFCPPSTDLANFWDYTLNTSNGASACPVHRLDNDSLVNCLYFSDPDGGTNLAVNLDWHLEFRTTSALWQIGLCTLPIEALHQAQLSLVASGFFFQNETHKTALHDVMASITPIARKILPTLSLAPGPIGATARAASAAYSGAKMVMSMMPRGGAKPTTLRVKTSQPAAKPKPKRRARQPGRKR